MQAWHDTESWEFFKKRFVGPQAGFAQRVCLDPRGSTHQPPKGAPTRYMQKPKGGRTWKVLKVTAQSANFRAIVGADGGYLENLPSNAA